MALEGSLIDFGLADILQLIYFQKKSGILTLSSRRDRVQITFHEGNIVAADSRKRTEENRLGRILLKKGLISESDLRGVLEEEKSTGMKVSDILINKGMVSRDDIAATVALQVTDTVTQLFSWKEGTYEFQVQPTVQKAGIPLTLDTQHLLMDGLRVLDEWSLIEGKVTLDMVFRKTGTAGAGLTITEEAVLSYVDGDNDISIIMDLTGIDDFEASKAVVSLIEKGLIARVEISPVAAEEILPAEAASGSSANLLPAFLLIAAFIISAVIPLLRGSPETPGSFLGGASSRGREAVRDIDALRFRVEEFRYRQGSYPADLRQVGSERDVWGKPYLYRTEGDGKSVVIVSAGPDGIFGTADDVY
ncbi:MAG TPA: DUF4388 domain-containing protein [Thermodesulfovibrionales bacterium]|nr:DUF4388 domain-containing protein [Thermodesulfovibrionales bacterium]